MKDIKSASIYLSCWKLKRTRNSHWYPKWWSRGTLKMYLIDWLKYSDNSNERSKMEKRSRERDKNRVFPKSVQVQLHFKWNPEAQPVKALTSLLPGSFWGDRTIWGPSKSLKKTFNILGRTPNEYDIRSKYQYYKSWNALNGARVVEWNSSLGPCAGRLLHNLIGDNCVYHGLAQLQYLNYWQSVIFYW